MSTVRLPDALRAPVVGAETGRAWVRSLVAAGLEFHLEESAHTIGRLEGGRWRVLFSPADAHVVNTACRALYALPSETWGGPGACPIAYMMAELEKRDAVGPGPTPEFSTVGG